MKKSTVRLLISLLFIAVFFLFQYFQNPQALERVVLSTKDEAVPAKNFQVTKVVDGDTIEVNINGKKEKIRVIGINTPETVDPRREVECFGHEASSKAKEMLEGKTVRLEFDPTQGERDRYGRLLRYVFVNNEDYGLVMIQEGFAYEYTYEKPYKFQQAYKNAQIKAQDKKAGLWGDAC